jgi:hypothetical protein
MSDDGEVYSGVVLPVLRAARGLPLDRRWRRDIRREITVRSRGPLTVEACE